MTSHQVQFPTPPSKLPKRPELHLHVPCYPCSTGLHKNLLLLKIDTTLCLPRSLEKFSFVSLLLSNCQDRQIIKGLLSFANQSTEGNKDLGFYPKRLSYKLFFNALSHYYSSKIPGANRVRPLQSAGQQLDGQLQCLGSLESVRVGCNHSKTKLWS